MIQDFDYASNPIVIQGASDLSVKVMDEDGNEVTTLTAEAYNGSASIDAHAIVEGMFKDEQTEHSASLLMSIQEDKLLQAVCGIKVGSMLMQQYTFVRGIGETNARYLLTKLGYKMTTPSSADLHFVVEIYDGYPKPLTFLLGHPIIGIYMSGEPFYTTAENKLLTLYPTPTYYVYEIDDANYTTHITAVSKAVPQHPFYVRWINNKGGWESWMFACNQKRTRQLTTNDYYERYDAAGQMTTYNKEGKEVIEVSSGVVDEPTREEISRLIYSPLIQWYDKSRNEWVNIQVEKGDSEWMTATPTNELVMSFLLPKPLIAR